MMQHICCSTQVHGHCLDVVMTTPRSVDIISISNISIPNDTWHVDGYDKLSTYGIHINGYVSIFYATDYNIAVAFTPTCLYNPHNLHS